MLDSSGLKCSALMTTCVYVKQMCNRVQPRRSSIATWIYREPLMAGGGALRPPVPPCLVVHSAVVRLLEHLLAASVHHLCAHVAKDEGLECRCHLGCRHSTYSAHQ